MSHTPERPHANDDDATFPKPTEEGAPAPPEDDPADIVDEHRTEKPVEDMGGEID